jgi:tetratricopeptide (TPR) repeat protein
MSATENASRLTVAIIAKNAEDGLRETLESIVDIADEIVVVDTGSTDGTRAVAEKYATHILDHEWNHDFSAARNAALASVTGNWVLWLDAGETIVANDAKSLRTFVNEDANISSAYFMVIQVPPHGNTEAVEQIARIRLVPNLPGLKFVGRVRETIVAALDQAGLQQEGIPQRIHRGPREHETTTRSARAYRNRHLAELEISESERKSHLLNCLGDACQTLDENLVAATHFQESLAMAERGSVDMLEAYYGLLTSFDASETNYDAQISICNEALAIFPLDAQLLCAMGGYLQAAGRIDLARKTYQIAYDFGKIENQVWHVGEVRDIAAICYSLVLQIQEDLPEARRILEQALAGSKDNVRLRRHLMELQIKQGDVELALEQVDRLPPETPHRPALRSAVRGAGFAMQQNWIAAKDYLNAGYTAGCRDPLCLRWLTMTLIAAGETEAARKHLDEWIAAEPNNAEAVRIQESISNAATPAAVSRPWRVDSADETRTESKPESKPGSTAASKTDSAERLP